MTTSRPDPREARSAVEPEERAGDTDVAPDPEAALYSTVPLEDEDGNEYVIEQQNVGRENTQGGGEWPDPSTPAQTSGDDSKSDETVVGASSAETSDPRPLDERCRAPQLQRVSMTISMPNPDVNSTGGEVDEFIDNPAEPEPPPSPTPHPGEPDPRPVEVRDPGDEEIQEGISSPNVGP